MTVSCQPNFSLSYSLIRNKKFFGNPWSIVNDSDDQTNINGWVALVRDMMDIKG